MMAQAGPSPNSVRRVAPDSLPKVPGTVRRDLVRRGCLVPQPYDARKPTNVAHGAFTAPKVSEWAILCSAHDTSEILIYRASGGADLRPIDSLERASDLAWMQRISDTQWGFSRLLGTLPLDRIRTWRRDDAGRSIPRPSITMPSSRRSSARRPTHSTAQRDGGIGERPRTKARRRCGRGLRISRGPPYWRGPNRTLISAQPTRVRKETPMRRRTLRDASRSSPEPRAASAEPSPRDCTSAARASRSTFAMRPARTRWRHR